MGGGPSRFRQGFSCPALLDKTCIKSTWFSRTRLSRSLDSHSNYSANQVIFLLYPVDDSRWSQITGLDKSRTVTWSHVISQPHIIIRLSAYLSRRIKDYKVWALTVSLATTPAIVIYFLFLNLLRCFSSVGSLQIPYFIQEQLIRHDSYWVSPFGNSRIKACLQLPETYRSLSRPSSPVSTKAFTLCPLKLDSFVRNQLVRVNHLPLCRKAAVV